MMYYNRFYPISLEQIPILMKYSNCFHTYNIFIAVIYSNRFYAISLKQIPILMMYSNRFYTYNIFKADTYTNDILQSFLSNFFRANTFTNLAREGTRLDDKVFAFNMKC